MFNKVFLIGNLGDDVKIKRFDDGGAVATFPLATSETYKKKDGEKETKTQWHNIVVRNKSAEICDKYLKKGDKIQVEGKVTYRKYTDSNGNDKYITEIAVFNFLFLNTKGESGDVVTAAKTTTKTTTNSEPDDMPF